MFGHATQRGLYLHFKLQETENDDNRRGEGESDRIEAALDGGDLGAERRLYCRELIARYGHELALNWNLGEENTQSTEQQLAMAGYLHDTDPYDHHIVVHTFPGQQDKVYGAIQTRTPSSPALHYKTAISRTHTYKRRSGCGSQPRPGW